jgi:hypothetical protein
VSGSFTHPIVFTFKSFRTKTGSQLLIDDLVTCFTTLLHGFFILTSNSMPKQQQTELITAKTHN